MSDTQGRRRSRLQFSDTWLALQPQMLGQRCFISGPAIRDIAWNWLISKQVEFLFAAVCLCIAPHCHAKLKYSCCLFVFPCHWLWETVYMIYRLIIRSSLDLLKSNMVGSSFTDAGNIVFRLKAESNATPRFCIYFIETIIFSSSKVSLNILSSIQRFVSRCICL